MKSQPTAIDMVAVGLLLAVSGIAYSAAGIRFDASPFPSYIQFIDEELLTGRFIESIWYSHAHPPGLNVLVGASYAVLHDAAPAFLSIFFHGLGAVLAFATFALTLRLTGLRLAAYVCTALLVMSPGFVLYENWLMYTFIEAALLSASAVALYQTLDRGSTTWAFALFAILAVLVLTRGFFHLGWLGLVVCYVAWASPKRAQVFRAAAIPFAVATLWYAKNYVYYGTFAASTMFGLGLSNVGTLTVPRAELVPLVEEGLLSPLALVSRYEDTALLFSARNETPRGIPVLDEPRKESGAFNYNYEPLIAINEQYARDSFAVIRRYPASYVIAVLIANRLFFSPSSMNEYFSPANRAAAEPFERIFNPAIYGVAAEPAYIAQPHFGFDRPPSLEVNTSVRLIGLWVLVLIFGWLRVRRLLFANSPVDDRVAAITLGYLILVMIYVHSLGTLVELGENYRYRFVVEPLFFVAAAVAATHALRRLNGLKRRRNAKVA